MKRNHESEEQGEKEVPKEMWIEIFRKIADERLFQWSTVSKQWERWIKEEGLTEFVREKPNFIESVKHLSEYKSIVSALIRIDRLKKSDFSRDDMIFFSQLKHANFIGRKGEGYMNILKRIPNLVSLCLNLTHQTITTKMTSNWVNLKTLFLVIRPDIPYRWISQMTQIETLILDYTFPNKLAPFEIRSIDASIGQLTCLKVLHMMRAQSGFAFLDKLVGLEKFIVDGIVTYTSDQPLHLPKLTRNLRQLMLTENSTHLSISAGWNNLKKIECLCIDFIPDDIVAFCRQLPTLKHIVLGLEYDYFVSNLKLLVKFAQQCPESTTHHLFVLHAPDITKLKDTYFYLLNEIPMGRSEAMIECNCCHNATNNRLFHTEYIFQHLFK